MVRIMPAHDDLTASPRLLLKCFIGAQATLGCDQVAGGALTLTILEALPPLAAEAALKACHGC